MNGGYSSPNDSEQSLLSKPSSRSPSSSPSRKRSFTEMNGYHDEDETQEVNKMSTNNGNKCSDMEINVGNNKNNEPSPKKQKLMNGHSLTTPQRTRIEKNRLAAIEKLKLHKMNSELPRVYVVDLETTSFPPKEVSVENGDVIIEIAIVQFNRPKKDLYTVKPVLHCFINPESYDKYPKNWRDAWIFKNGTTVEMVEECGLDQKAILPQIRKILNGHYVTSYCTDFDLNRFLKQDPYNVECKDFECIMKMCSKEMNCINPSLKDAAHDFLGMDYRWGFHNAMEDALTAAKILSQVVDDQ